MKVQRISDPQVSPDGRWIAYVQGAVDFEANKVVKHIWLIRAEGGEPKQLTAGDGSDSRPRWSPDGESIAFISTRGGKSQVVDHSRRMAARRANSRASRPKRTA